MGEFARNELGCPYYFILPLFEPFTGNAGRLFFIASRCNKEQKKEIPCKKQSFDFMGTHKGTQIAESR